MFDKIEAGGGEPPTKQFWSSVTTGMLMTYYGDYPCARCANLNDEAVMSFHVPHDFHQIREAYIVVIPRVTQAAADWWIFSDYAAIGEAYQTHTEQDVGSTFNVTNEQIYGVDISGILTSLAANDYVGVYFLLADAAHDVDVLGVMFKYD